MKKYTKHFYATFERDLINPTQTDSNLVSLRNLAAYAVASGATLKAKGTKVEYMISHRAVDTTTLQFLAVVLPGAGYTVELENVFLAVELTNAQMSGMIPVGVRDSIRLDENEDPRSWQDYVDSVHPNQVEEALDNSKRIVYLPGDPYSDHTEIMALTLAGLSIKTQSEVNVLKAPGGDYVENEVI